jgi:hypothetical protein
MNSFAESEYAAIESALGLSDSESDGEISENIPVTFTPSRTKLSLTSASALQVVLLVILRII